MRSASSVLVQYTSTSMPNLLGEDSTPFVPKGQIVDHASIVPRFSDTHQHPSRTDLSLTKAESSKARTSRPRCLHILSHRQQKEMTGPRTLTKGKSYTIPLSFQAQLKSMKTTLTSDWHQCVVATLFCINQTQWTWLIHGKRPYRLRAFPKDLSIFNIKRSWWPGTALTISYVENTQNKSPFVVVRDFLTEEFRQASTSKRNRLTKLRLKASMTCAFPLFDDYIGEKRKIDRLNITNMFVLSGIIPCLSCCTPDSRG